MKNHFTFYFTITFINNIYIRWLEGLHRIPPVTSSQSSLALNAANTGTRRQRGSDLANDVSPVWLHMNVPDPRGLSGTQKESAGAMVLFPPQHPGRVLMNIDPNTTKYMVKAKINADGIVEKPDVVGAIFGQTEGLLGDELDLRDLQKSGRIGRIEVEVTSKGGKSEGIIYMSSSLDQVETVILASALETVDRVGPCKASIHVLGSASPRGRRSSSAPRSCSTSSSGSPRGPASTSQTASGRASRSRRSPPTERTGAPPDPT